MLEVLERLETKLAVLWLLGRKYVDVVGRLPSSLLQEVVFYL